MPVKIIDTHQHLWNLQKLRLPWVDTIPPLNRSFDCDDYSRFTSQTSESEFDYEIEQSLYMEVDVQEKDIELEIETITKLCEANSNPLIGIIASARPESETFPNSVQNAKSHPWVRGFRRVLHTDATPAGTCLTPRFLDSMRLLGANGFPFDLCMRPTELDDAKTLALNCPETQFVLDHCGNPDVRMTQEQLSKWESSIQSLGNCPNVACKISGFVWTIQDSQWSYEKSIAPILKTVYKAFGPDRILFGGDWPVCTLSALSFQQWLNAIHRFATETEDLQPDQVFRRNAKQIYRL